jgi:hypothetical protein
LRVDAVSQDVAFRMIVENSKAAANHGLIVEGSVGKSDSRRKQVSRIVKTALCGGRCAAQKLGIDGSSGNIAGLARRYLPRPL